MSEATSRANGRRSKIRAFVEHVFARQKVHMKLFIRTINLTRFVWHERKSASA